MTHVINYVSLRIVYFGDSENDWSGRRRSRSSRDYELQIAEIISRYRTYNTTRMREALAISASGIFDTLRYARWNYRKQLKIN